MLRRLPWLIVPLLALAGPAQAQSAGAPTAEAVLARLDAWRASASFPGATVALAVGDRPVVTASIGVADPDAGTPLRPGHRMLVGSVGKIYVSALAQRLAAAGKLDLDARLADHLGDRDWFARVPNGADITLRQLLRHQSGIPRYVFQPAFWEALLAAPDRQWQPHELVAYVADAEPLFAAGAGWAYSDTNYLLLGLVLEKVGGAPFYAQVQRAFLEPLGLADTIPSDSRRLPGMAQGAVVAGRQLGLGERTLDAEGVFTFNPQFEWCGGGWASTPADLAAFARALYSGSLLGEDSLGAMLDAVPAPALGPDAEYGLGVIVRPSAHGPLIGHDGFMPGYLTSVGYFPELDTAVAVQLNTDDARAAGRPLSTVLADFAGLAAGPQDPAGEEVAAAPVMVFLVRHAEKDTSDPADRNPALTAAGEQRAAELARVLGGAGVTHLYASEFRRTQLTLQPLAKRIDGKIEVVGARDAAHLLSALRALPPGSVAVVAGHSNTVPALALALGGRLTGLVEHPSYGALIPEAEHDRLVQLVLPAGAERAVQCLELRYGRAAE